MCSFIKDIIYIVFVAILIFSVSTCYIYPQDYQACSDLEYRDYTIRDGLSGNSVNSICQDTTKFLWVATDSGLNRFDGIKFIRFFTNENQKLSIPDNHITVIHPSENGDIWIGTKEKGIIKYSYANNRFYTLRELGIKNDILHSAHINVILEENKKALWVGSRAKGLNKINLKTKSILTYNYQPDSGLCSDINNINSITKDDKGDIWFKTDKCIGVLKLKDNKVVTLNIPKQIELGDAPGSFIPGSGKFLWTFYDNGLLKIIPGSLKIEIHPIKEFSSSKKTILSIARASGDKFWLGTSDGLYKYSIDSTLYYCSKRGYSSGIPDREEIRALYVDKTNSIWIGTKSQGLRRLNLDKEKFKSFTHIPGNDNSLSGTLTTALLIDSKNNIWIGYASGAVDVMLNKTQNIVKLKNSNIYNSEESIGHTTCIMERSNGEVWVANPAEKISVYNKKLKLTGKIDIFNIDSLSITKTINHLKEDRFGNIWIGTNTGLFLYDNNRGHARSFRHNPSNPNSLTPYDVRPNCIEIDEWGNIWVATWGGLSKLTPSNANVNSFHVDYKITQYLYNKKNTGSFVEYRILSLHYNPTQDPNNIFVGTQGTGLLMIKFSNSSEDIVTTIYNKDNRLPDNTVYTIESDNNNNLWLGTNSGLACLDIYKNKTTVYFKETDQFSGIPFWRTSYSGYYGELLFGGRNGFYLFTPQELSPGKNKQRIVFTGISVLDTPLKVNQAINGDVILTQDIHLTRKIDLKHTSNSFSIDFAVLNYNNPDNNIFQYKLMGYDNNWFSTSNQNAFAKYKNLKPGKYTFMVKASNFDGAWETGTIKMHIVITPPFFKKQGVIYTLSLVLACLIIILMRFKNKKMIRSNQFLEDLVLERTLELSNKNTQLMQQTEQLSAINENLHSKQEYIRKQSQALITQKNELIKANKTKDKLFGIIAHDLKGPINNAKGYADLLIYRFKHYDDSKKRSILKSLGNSIETLYNLLVTISNWSGTEHGEVIFEPVPHYINDVINENLELLNIELLKKRIRVINNTTDKLLKVEIDRNLFDTVLRNILSNAIKFSNMDGTITIECQDTPDDIEITISDTGIGIEQDNIDKLLNNEFLLSTHGTLNESGTGLGFLVGKKYIERHHGELYIDSKAKIGTTVHIKLPLKQPSSSKT